MAENEYLDVTKAARWQSVIQAIRSDLDIDEITELVRDRFYKTLRQICKDVPFAELLNAVDDPHRLKVLADSCEGGLDVKNLLRFAVEETSGKANVVEHFLNQALGNILYDIPYLVSRTDQNRTLSELRSDLRVVQHRMLSDIRRMAAKFAENPSWSPRAPRTRMSTKQTPTDRTRKKLGESLIAGRKK